MFFEAMDLYTVEHGIWSPI